MGSMAKNWWTTLTGIIGAVGIYVTAVGTKFPETKQEWTAFLIGLVLAVLGYVAKDATTGSAPK